MVDSTSRPMTHLRAFIGSEIGSDPDFEPYDEDPEYGDRWRVVSVHQGVGGVMEATLVYDMGIVGSHTGQDLIENWNVRDLKGYRVEIFSLFNSGEDEGKRDVALFRGEITDRDMNLSTNESQVYRARLKPGFFERRCDGAIVWDPGEEEFFVTSNDLFFNPVVDGKVHNNRDKSLSGKSYGLSGNNKFHPIIDPESGLSDVALTYLGQEAEEWTLSQVVSHFLWTLNAFQNTVKNPDVGAATTPDEVDEEMTVLDDAPPVKDLKLPRGQYLPYYLTQVLNPSGYMWSVDPSHDINEDASHVELRIRIFQRGRAPDEESEKILYLDAPGDDLDVSNVEEARFTTSLAQVPSALIAEGGFKEYEVTLPLYRGWNSDEDGNFNTEDSNDAVGRLWVANEGWDYTELRPEINTPNLNDGLEITEFVIRRRPAHDCLTTYINEVTNKKTRRPPFAEYSNDDGATWQSVEERWGYRVLSDQIGIRFHTIPTELTESGVLVRLTCTVASDTRLFASEDFTNDEVPIEEHQVFLDLSDEFKFRQRMATGDYASVLTGDADTVNDILAMDDKLTKLGVNCKSFPLHGSARLHGLNFDYKVGDIITGIPGRSISFKTYTDTSVDPNVNYYAQITGITWQHFEQKTLLEFAPSDAPEVV